MGLYMELERSPNEKGSRIQIANDCKISQRGQNFPSAPSKRVKHSCVKYFLRMYGSE